MPLGLQPTHLIIIVIVALLIFGPSLLPQLGRSFGSTLRELGTATKEAADGFSEEIAPQPEKKEPAPTSCNSCSRPIQPGMRFCPECGAEQANAATR